MADFCGFNKNTSSCISAGCKNGSITSALRFLTANLVIGEFSVHHSWDLASESNPECLGTIIGRLLVNPEFLGTLLGWLLVNQ